MAKFQKDRDRAPKGGANGSRSKNARPKNSRERRQGNDRDDKRTSLDAENDVSWYTRYPELLVSAGTFPFPNRPGMSVNLGEEGADGYSYTIPGIMVLDWIPSVGRSNQPTDPASILGAEMYARVRKAYSGTLRADAPDYIIYVMALDSVYAYIAYLKRIYRTLNAYTPDNYVLPDMVLGAMGLTRNDMNLLRSSRMDLWGAINTLVQMSRRFSCPGSLDIINRHYWMSDNLYTDDATINSQFYLFNPRGFYKYGTVKDTNNQDVPALLFQDAPGYSKSSINVAQLFKFGQDMIDALAAWDDSYTINGYLQRAYEGTPLFLVEEIAQDDMLVPQYVPEVLLQIENSMGIPGANTLVNFSGSSADINLTISQDVPTNSVLFTPEYTFTPVGTPGELPDLLTTMRHFISQRTATPTALENTIATRLQANFDVSTISGGYKVTIKGATEIPLGWRFVEELPTSSKSMSDYIPVALTTLLPTDATVSDYKQLVMALDKYAKLAAFDWHPFFFITSGDELIPVGDVHNITVVGKDQMDKLNRVCLFSEFNSFSML